MEKENLKDLIKREGNDKRFEYRGFRCRIIRNNPEFMGNLCGYIAIPPDNKLYEKKYDDIESLYDYELPAHGGLTFSGQIDGEFMIGFDCAHIGDLLPCTTAKSIYKDDTYKDMEYVTQNIKQIIDFILEMDIGND